MNNYLVITIGTRDVQLRRDRIEAPDSGWFVEDVPDPKTNYKTRYIEREGVRIPVMTSPDFPNYYTIKPRSVGKTLADAATLSLFGEVLELPLIGPVVDHLTQQGVVFHKVLLIYTNQQQEFEAGVVKAFHYQNDTIHLAGIIEQVLQTYPPLARATFDPYEIFERVADIDYQYAQFGAKNQNLLDTDDVGTIFLLPQGGIDQINQAVTLQLIQAHKHKVRLYHKPDGGNPAELGFTRQFLNDLNRQKIEKHLADYDFGYIDKSLTDNRLVLHLAQYAYRRLQLQHNQLQPHVDFLTKQPALTHLHPTLLAPVQTNVHKLADLYASAKISAAQGRYADFLWKVFTLNESLFRVRVEAQLGPCDSYRSDGRGHAYENPDWISFLNRANTGLVAHLRTKGIGLSGPFRKAYQAIYTYLNPTDPMMPVLKRVGEKIELLARKRHELAHAMGATSKNELNQTLPGYGVDGLLTDLDAVFGMQGLGLYDTLRQQIHNLL